MSAENVNPLEGRVTQLEIQMAVVQSDVKKVTDDIKSIRDDTKWMRRAITNALIVAGIGGAFTLFFTLIKFFLLR